MTVTVEVELVAILERIEGKIDDSRKELEQRIEKVEQKVDDTRKELEQRIEKVEQKVDDTRKELEQKIEKVDDQVDKLVVDVKEVKGEIKALEAQVGGYDTRIKNQEFLTRTITVALGGAFFASVLRLLFPALGNI